MVPRAARGRRVLGADRLRVSALRRDRHGAHFPPAVRHSARGQLDYRRHAGRPRPGRGGRPARPHGAAEIAARPQRQAAGSPRRLAGRLRLGRRVRGRASRDDCHGPAGRIRLQLQRRQPAVPLPHRRRRFAQRVGRGRRLATASAQGLDLQRHAAHLHRPQAVHRAGTARGAPGPGRLDREGARRARTELARRDVAHGPGNDPPHRERRRLEPHAPRERFGRLRPAHRAGRPEAAARARPRPGHRHPGSSARGRLRHRQPQPSR